MNTLSIFKGYTYHGIDSIIFSPNDDYIIIASISSSCTIFIYDWMNKSIVYSILVKFIIKFS